MLNKMQTRVNFLSLMLLDALEDENASDIYAILQRSDVNPSYVPSERGIAPIHYVCGMPNPTLALNVMQRLLAMSTDTNVQCDGGLTPLHIAVFYGRLEIVRLLLEHGAVIDVCDDEQKTPAHYAIDECHFEILELMREHILKAKQARRRSKRTFTISTTPSTPQRNSNNEHIVSTSTPEVKPAVAPNTPKTRSAATPTKIYYNHDPASPYYINITHRRHKPQPQFADEPSSPRAINLLTLTRDNLAELAEQRCSEQQQQTLKQTLIESWRQKVEQTRARRTLFTNSAAALSDDNEAFASDADEVSKASSRTTVNVAAQTVEIPTTTSPPLIRSPTNNEYFMQLAEGYVHTDDENGLVFYERKLPNNHGNVLAVQRARSPTPTPSADGDGDCGGDGDGNCTKITATTNLTLPLDYETDALRQELTQFGACVGPITKTTKRLYIKRLIKYKRQKARSNGVGVEAGVGSVTQQQPPKFSVELKRTLRSAEDFERISEFYALAATSATHFANISQSGANSKRPLREGNLKQSFIYLLIDPLRSCNLPGESAFLDNFVVWRRFLGSIFYVGKGKSTRPYAHLYEAMKVHTQLTEAAPTKTQLTRLRLSDAPTTPSKKLKRILEIWRQNQGVVCLHVFHNIMPTDAYTREASIIEALTLPQLTNIKRGDYYGPARSWSMKDKKHMGIALLHKAMQIYIAEGESQLAPCDLVKM